MSAQRRAAGSKEPTAALAKRKPAPRRRRKSPSREAVLFCAVECKYECVIDAVTALGWRIVGERAGRDAENGKASDDLEVEQCNVYWIDVANIHDRMAKMKPWQRVNHFPGMNHVARKNRLAQNLEKMRREFAKEYAFFPRTWVLPLELADFRAQFDANGKSSRFYIIKPDAGCQGRGIFLTQDFDDVSPMEQVVAQHYIRKPFLIDDFKFDLRLYVLVTSCAPLRMHLFHDGLVRLCTEAYVKPSAENVAMRCMHLTNYAINKNHENFEKADGAGDQGSKRSLKWFMAMIAQEKGQAKADALWRRMGSMCTKVIISILPTLVREYDHTFFRDSGGHDPEGRKKSGRRAGAPPAKSDDDADDGAAPQSAPSSAPSSSRPRSASDADGSEAADAESSSSEEDSEAAAAAFAAKARQRKVEGSRCFEVLGIDIMMDHALKPWLVEINHLPSFATDSALDKEIKSRVIEQALAVIRAMPHDRKVHEQQQRAQAEGRLYRTRESEKAPSQEQVAVLLADEVRRKVEALLKQHAPDKLEKLQGLLKKYVGREDKLLRLVERKYVSGDGLDDTGPVDERSRDDLVPRAELPTRPKVGSRDGSSAPGRGSRGSSDSAPAPGRPLEAFAAPPLDDVDEHTDSECEYEDERLVDWDRIYPVPSEARRNQQGHIPDYATMIDFVFANEEKRFKRLSCPLKQHRGSALDFSEGALPPLGGGEPKEARLPWGDPGRRNPATGGGLFAGGAVASGVRRDTQSPARGRIGPTEAPSRPGARPRHVPGRLLTACFVG
ncbi:tubulin-tyrosine ligase family-domain-containing protein [Pelagophyceae sp. CCMP2097]|nr:tubulin-tyrosine ligase family-domain-containing protein [Pelagophyceae sp. CCMP2097]